jgi:hypothetical protein
MTDERFDQTLRAALEWHATRAAATQPGLRQVTHQVAIRLAPIREVMRPRVMLAPAAGGALNLIFVLLLLLALAAAVAVGAFLLRESPDNQPGPFGFAGACGVPLETGDVASFGVQGGFRHLHSSGSLHSDPIIPDSANGQDLSRTNLVESTAFLERKLTPLGVQAVQERISELGLAPGCVRLHAEDSGGSVYVRTDAGVSGVAWYPYEGSYGLARRATGDEEQVLADLAADLSDLDAWLPPDAWVERDEQRVLPDQWLVFLTLTDGIRASSAYAEIALPGGVEPAAFGEALTNDPIDLAGATESRCGLVDRPTALAVAASIDSAHAARWTGLLPAFPDGVDCAWLDAEAFGQEPPEPTPFIDGEFAHLDPCEWVPLAAAESISTAPPELIARRGVGPFGTWDPLCEVRDVAVMGTRATVMVLSRSVSTTEAREIALGLLGGSGGEEQIFGHPAWINDCLTSDLPCWWSMAVSAEPYFLVFAIDARDDFSPDGARAFAEAVVQSIDGP